MFVLLAIGLGPRDDLNFKMSFDRRTPPEDVVAVVNLSTERLWRWSPDLQAFDEDEMPTREVDHTGDDPGPETVSGGEFRPLDEGKV